MAAYISQHGTKRGSSRLVGLPKKQNLLVGGKSDDVFFGSIFGDRLRGGAGADSFFYTSSKESRPGKRKADEIEDFSFEDGDRIILPNNLIEEGKSRKFKYIGDDEFSSPGQISYTKGNLKINLDSDNRPEMVIKLKGNPFVDESAFVYESYLKAPKSLLFSETPLGAPIPGWVGGYIDAEFSLTPKIDGSVQTWFDGKSAGDIAGAIALCTITAGYNCPPFKTPSSWGFTFSPSIELSGSITLTAGKDPYEGNVLIPSISVGGPSVSDPPLSLGTSLSMSGTSTVSASGSALGQKHVISYGQDIGFALKGNGSTGFDINSTTGAPSVSVNKDSLTGLVWKPKISHSINLSGGVGLDLEEDGIGVDFEMLSLGGAISTNLDFSIAEGGSSLAITETAHPTGSVGKACVNLGAKVCFTLFDLPFPSDMTSTLYGPKTIDFG